MSMLFHLPIAIHTNDRPWSRRMRSTFIAAIAFALSAPFLVNERANAQSVGVGVGVYGGPRYLPPYPYFGAYPLAYPGFYGNGMSMYGPPVPTYGPVPGTFGASDYRVIQNPPYVGFPIGIYATYSPRRGVSGTREPQLLDEAIRGPLINDKLMVEVRVPLENVIVFINDRITKQSGQIRYFASPSLSGDESYRYTIRAVWTIDGQRNDKTVVVNGKPGERALADFTR
jgi:uncharacterized protein (TIGR03000 family)